MEWRELRFICLVPLILTWRMPHIAFGRDDGTFQMIQNIPNLQPAASESIVRKRDNTGATAEIFIAKRQHDGQTNVVLDPTKRDDFDNTQVAAEVRRARQGVAEGGLTVWTI